MGKIERFEDMEVWQSARRLSREVYILTSKGKFSRDFGLKDQIQRAAVSIMSNIAEGFERSSTKEFLQFLNIAKGSTGEVRSQLYIALDIGYINKDCFDKLYLKTTSISKQLSGFRSYLKTKLKEKRVGKNYDQ